MKTKLNIAYSLLTDLDILKNEKVLGIDEISELESRNLSHRLINNSLGKLYLQYYYAPMIVTAFKYFKDKYNFLELGCGTGTQVIYGMKMGFHSAMGIDLLSSRIKIAQKRINFYGTNSDKRVTIETMNFWNLNYEKQFSAIYSMFAFELFGFPAEKASKHLSALCSTKATIVFDMGRVKRLHKQRYFSNLMEGLVNEGFKVRFVPLLPCMVGSRFANSIGKWNLWPYFHAIRLIAERK